MSKPPILVPFVLIVLCIDLTFAVNSSNPQGSDSQFKDQIYSKETATKHPLPYYFLSTYHGLANELTSTTEGFTQATPIPAGRLYKNFGKLVPLKINESSQLKDQIDTIQKLWEASQVDETSTSKYLRSILLPYSSNEDLFQTPPASSDDTAKVKLTAKLTELSKLGKFNEMLIMSINSFEIYYALAPIYQADHARFFDILEDHDNFKSLDERSQKIVIQSFGNLPTQREIQNRTEMSENEFIAQYVRSKWADLTTSDYANLRKNLVADFSKNHQVYTRQYETLLLKKNAEVVDRQGVFSSYINKAQIHHEIIQQRLEQATLTTKVTAQGLQSGFIERLLRTYKFEVQFTPVVDAFEYLKPGLNRILQMFVQHKVINKTEKQILQAKFQLNISQSFNNKSDQLHESRLERKIGSRSAQDSLAKRLEKILNGDRKHFAVYHDRLAYQIEMGNFAKLTPFEAMLRELLEQEIKAQEGPYEAELRGENNSTAALDVDLIIPSGQRSGNGTPNSRWAFIMRESSVTNGSTVHKNLNSGSYLDDGIIEIKSHRVVDLYKGYTPAQKQIFMEIVSSNINKLTGTSTDIKKVHALIHYEKLHDHNNRFKFAADSYRSKDILTSLIPADGRLLSLESDTHLSPSKLGHKFSQRRERRGKLTKVSKHSRNALQLASSVAEGFEVGDDITNPLNTALQVTEEAYDVYRTAKTVTKAVYGAKSAVTTVVKATRTFKSVLGRAAGPVGDLLDIGLSSWSLATAIQRLNDPNADKFDQDDAIADIVENSVSIGLAATSLVVSLAFPPAAPFVAAFSFLINLFTSIAVKWTKADTHVRRIESHLPLLDFEKSREWGRNFNGQETSYYIQGLIKAKAENNDIVAQSVEFLEAEPNFLGKITPAVSIAISTRRECHDKPKSDAEFHPLLAFLGPLAWIGGGISVAVQNGAAAEQECNDITERDPIHNPNSIVDLRQQGYYFKDRSSPDVDKVEEYGAMRNYEIFCYPGSTTDQTYKISERHQTYGYLCHHAIGVQRKTRGSGANLMLIDLADGDDTVYSNSNNDIFMVQAGVKNFYGAGGNDTFIVANCISLQGVLDGGPGRDTLELQQDCASGWPISLVQSPHHSHHVNIQGIGRTGIHISDMEALIGRAGETDWVEAAQDFEVINLMGGGASSKESWDLIEINGPPKISTRNMRILVPSTTQVRISSYGHGVVYLNLLEVFATGFHLLLHPRNQTIPKVDLLIEFDDLDAIDFKTNNSAYNIELFFEEGRTIGLTFVDTESDQLNRHFKLAMLGIGSRKELRINLNEETTDVAHHLNSNSNEPRFAKGAKGAHNFFNLYQGTWNVDGSGHDTFIVHLDGGNLEGICVTPDTQGSHGLQVRQTSLNVSVSYDFETGTFVASRANLIFEGITTFRGQALTDESVICNCQSTHVHTGGGSSSKTDFIYYNSTCAHKNPLTILAMGNTRIRIGPSSLGNRNVLIRIKLAEDFATPITISRTVGRKASQGRVQIFMPIRTSDVQDVTLDISPSKVSFRFIINEFNFIQFNFHMTNPYSSEEFEHLDVNTDIFFLPKGPGKTFALIRRDNLQVEIMHELFQSRKTNAFIKRASVPKLTNVFFCAAGKWNVVGSGMDDRFYIQSTRFTGSLDGSGGNDTLVIETSVIGNVMVQLGENGFVTSESKLKAVKVQGMETFLGRQGFSETVIAGRDTLLISAGGGSKGSFDFIQVPHFEEESSLQLQQTTVIVDQNTIVTNFAQNGEYLYLIKDISNSSIHFDSSTAASHALEFQIPYTRLNQVNYNKDLKMLAMRFDIGQDFDVPYDLFEDDEDQRVTVQFMESSSLTCDVSVLSTGDIQVFMRSSKNQLNVRGVLGAKNVIYVDPSDQCLTDVVGSDQDDEFNVNIDSCIDRLQGGFLGTRNTLYIADADETRHDVIQVQLGTNGSVTVRDKSGSTKTLIKNVENIQAYEGPNETRSEVYIGCDTIQVKGAGVVYVTDFHCVDYKVDIWITAETNVIFRPFPQRNLLSSEITDWPGGTINYHFETIRSFDASAELYAELDQIDHVYHVPMAIDEIGSIQIKDNTLVYTVRNEWYSHRIYDLNYIDEDDKDFQFFSNPRLVASDGFNIQVTPYGKIFFTWNGQTTKSTESLITSYAPLAKTLQVNIIMQLPSEFLYFASSFSSRGTEGNGDDPPIAKDVISNYSPLKSHLVGDGGRNIFKIIDLQHDVHVYPFLYPACEGEQILDLVSVMAQLSQKENGTKYVPSVRQNGKSLVILMEGYKNQLPAQIIIDDAVRHHTKLRVRLRVYLMKIELQNGSNWELKPIPFIISDGTVAAVSAEDMEVDQEIVFAKEEVTKLSRRKRGALLESNVPSLARQGDQLIFSTLASSVATGGSSLILLDAFTDAEKREDADVPSFENIHIAVDGWETSWTLNASGLSETTRKNSSNLIDVHSVNSWNKVLEDVESELLILLPEIPRSFQQTTTVWYHVLYFGFVALDLSILLVAVVVVVVLVVRKCNDPTSKMTSSHHGNTYEEDSDFDDTSGDEQPLLLEDKED